MRHFHTLNDESNCLVLGMDRTVREERFRDTECRSPVNNRSCRALGRGVGARKKPHKVRVVVSQPEVILFIGDTRSGFDIIELQQVASRCPMDRRIKRLRYLPPFCCQKKMDAGANEGLDFSRQCGPEKRLTKEGCRRCRPAMSAWSSVCDEAQEKLKVDGVVWNPYSTHGIVP